MSRETEWHTERPDGFVVAVIEWYDGIETETSYGVYDPQNKEWTDGNHGVMVTPDRWIDINLYIEKTRAEIERLRAQIAEYIENNPVLRDWTGEEEDKAWEELGTHGSNATEVTFTEVIGSDSTNPVVHHCEGDSDSEEYRE